MNQNLNITINDFENICRTCLGRENLKPLYEKCARSANTLAMLMSCTLVKFIEDDGLPGNICMNCIHKINLAFSFAKYCKKTDTILRDCVRKSKTELTNKSIQSQKEKMKIEIKQEIILPNVEVLKGPEFVEKVTQEEYAEVKLEYEYDETLADPLGEGYKKEVDDYQDLSLPRRRSANSQIEEKSLEDDTPLAKRLNLSTDHQIIYTEEEGASYLCHVCGQEFTQLGTLKAHERIHTDERQNVCYICSKAFTKSFHLKRHMRTHTGEKPYICEVCNQDFIQSNELKRHMRIHTGEKPYSCGVCGKGFTQSSKLKVHMRIHTGEKPYSCGVCSKSFSTKYLFTVHTQTHAEET